MTKTLLLGYGNIDRQDDGVAWHILRGVARRFNTHLPDFPDETDGELTKDLIWLFSLQLTPESAELIGQYDQVIFIDAHTGAVQDNLHLAELDANFQTSPFTHHLTPQTCLALAQTLAGKAPRGILVSVRGYEFGFSRTLSEQTLFLCGQAVDQIVAFLAPNG